MYKRGEQKRRNSPGRKRTTKPRRARSEIPSKTTIVSTETFMSPKGRRYTILETNQIDPYDDPTNSERKRRGN
jgi:hypothetical protein